MAGRTDAIRNTGAALEKHRDGHRYDRWLDESPPRDD